jgi:hypothetical protein
MNLEVKEIVQGRRMGQPLGRRPRTHTAGRVCLSEGCDTLLSRYNPSERCRVHTSLRYPRLRGHVRLGDGAEAYDEA